MSRLSKILSEEIKEAVPGKKLVEEINQILGKIAKKLKEAVKKEKIKAEIFVGGSIAKGTLMSKEKYDADIFVRFDAGYEDTKISGMLEKIIKKAGLKCRKIHGSRDYFQLPIRKEISFEIVPSLKIKKPEEAKNVTDLSAFHVNYIRKKLNEKQKKEVLLAKRFCYAQNCYGAESYVGGFSGYGLELLIAHYKTFLKMIKAIASARENEKIVIDLAGKYKNRQEIMNMINEAKLLSPIVVIDPTYKERNALAALRQKTFEKFKKVCIEFLKNPSAKYFYKKEFNLKEFTGNEKGNLAVVKISTNKQAGDIAGSKMLKFSRFIEKQAERLFEISKTHFEYDAGQKAIFYLLFKPKTEIIFNGPMAEDRVNAELFRKAHRGKIKIKEGKLYAIEKINPKFEKFLEVLKKRYKKDIRDMGITEVKLIS